MVHHRPARRNQPRPMVFATPRYLGDREMGSGLRLRYYIYGYQAPLRHDHLHHGLRPSRPPFNSVKAPSSFYA